MDTTEYKQDQKHVENKGRRRWRAKDELHLCTTKAATPIGGAKNPEHLPQLRKVWDTERDCERGGVLVGLWQTLHFIVKLQVFTPGFFKDYFFKQNKQMNKSFKFSDFSTFSHPWGLPRWQGASGLNDRLFKPEQKQNCSNGWWW